MPSYLFLFCYETPEQLCTNAIDGTAVEEIRAILIEAESEDVALRCGVQVAHAHVKRVHEHEAPGGGVEWKPVRYRHWVEQCPHNKWSDKQLARIPRVIADGTLPKEEFSPLPLPAIASGQSV